MQQQYIAVFLDEVIKQSSQFTTFKRTGSSTQQRDRGDSLFFDTLSLKFSSLNLISLCYYFMYEHRVTAITSGYIKQPVATPEILIGSYSPRGLGNGSLPVGSGSGDELPQKLKQFTDIPYRFSLQKSPECETFTQFTPSFLTSMFHSGGLSDPIDGG